MSRPVRIQRQRTKGWKMPEGAVYVGRPTRFGNDILPSMLGADDRPIGLKRAVLLHRYAMERFADHSPDAPDWFAPLRGHDLACWCPLGQPCHADVLLELANR